MTGLVLAFLAINSHFVWTTGLRSVQVGLGYVVVILLRVSRSRVQRRNAPNTLGLFSEAYQDFATGH